MGTLELDEKLERIVIETLKLPEPDCHHDIAAGDQPQWDSVGRFVTMNCRSGLRHDVTVGDFTPLSAFCDVTGRAVLRRCVVLDGHSAAIPGKSVGDYAAVSCLPTRQL